MTPVTQSPKRSSGVKKCGLILVAVWIMVCILFVFGGAAVSAAEKGDKQVRIGVLAKRGSAHCLEQWGPTAEYLTRQIPGRSFSIVPLGFDEIHQAVEGSEVEFILANSSFYVDLEIRFGARRIATLNNIHVEKVSKLVLIRKRCEVYICKVTEQGFIGGLECFDVT